MWCCSHLPTLGEHDPSPLLSLCHHQPLCHTTSLMLLGGNSGSLHHAPGRHAYGAAVGRQQRAMTPVQAIGVVIGLILVALLFSGLRGSLVRPHADGAQAQPAALQPEPLLTGGWARRVHSHARQVGPRGGRGGDAVAHACPAAARVGGLVRRVLP